MISDYICPYFVCLSVPCSGYRCCILILVFDTMYCPRVYDLWHWTLTLKSAFCVSCLFYVTNRDMVVIFHVSLLILYMWVDNLKTIGLVPGLTILSLMSNVVFLVFKMKQSCTNCIFSFQDRVSIYDIAFYGWWPLTLNLILKVIFCVYFYVINHTKSVILLSFVNDYEI